jgi:hypothetical protein
MNYILSHALARQRALQAVRTAPEGHAVTIRPPTRSLRQNALLWALLDRFAGQLLWPVNGKMSALTPEEWKDVLTAAFRRENVRLAEGLQGGVVMLGGRTSKFSAAEMAEFLDFVQSVAVDRGVNVE